MKRKSRFPFTLAAALLPAALQADETNKRTFDVSLYASPPATTNSTPAGLRCTSPKGRGRAWTT